MLSHPAEKYRPYPPITLPDRRWPDRQISHAPRWLSTDLRDGNQALAEPMDSARKLQFWDLLLECGFKEIEVAFPSASQTDFNFVRQLIDEQRIPEEVTIQVLTQARDPLILRTFEALRGARRATVHLYNATAPLFRELVFGMDKAEVIALATRATRLIRQQCEQQPETRWQYEYSPETFCFTEPAFALEICEAVADVWQPCAERPMIVNLPATVEVNTPNVYADQIEYFCRHFSRRGEVCISVHPHNDRGTGVASAELAVMAGADRVEGCLFGNGERTGNVCLVTLAMNLYSQGVDPELRFEQMNRVVEVVENCNQIPVHPRHPWAGSLAYTAFSGSHQDAIAKGMHWIEEKAPDTWTVPYLPIDPTDIGRNYDADVIRINSQSGKGGVGYILETKYGLNLPAKMREAMSYTAKSVSDHLHKELRPDEIFELFKDTFENVTTPYNINGVHFKQLDEGRIEAQVTSNYEGGEYTTVYAEGNGRLNAVSNALKQQYNLQYDLVSYTEHALEQSSSAQAIAYVGIKKPDGILSWGAGVDPDIIRASIDALVTAINNR